MFLYSLKYYIRGLLRRKLFSFINIPGRAFGIAFMTLIGQFIYYEFSYNRSIENKIIAITFLPVNIVNFSEEPFKVKLA